MVESEMTEAVSEQSYAVPIPSLSSALDEVGLSLVEGSPLGRFCDSSNKKEKSDSSIDWPENWVAKEVLSCLTQKPTTAFTALLVDQKTHHFLFPWTDADSFCLYSHDSDSGHLTAPVAPGQVAAFIAEDFDPLRASPASGLEFSFSKQAFLAFAAVVDFCRYIYAAGLLERTAIPVHQCTLEQLYEQTKLARTNTDYRWMLACWSEFFPEDKGFEIEALKAGCDWLVEHELLIEDTEGGADQYILTVPLISVVSQFINLTLTTLITSSDDTKIALLSADALWKLDFSGDKIKLASIDGLQLITGVRETVTSSTSSVTNGASSKDPSACRQCGAEIERAQKFCSNCGSPKNV